MSKPSKIRLRRVRDERRRTFVVYGTILAIALVVLIPAIGYYREVVAKGDQPVAYVNGEAITLTTFMKLFGYHAASLDSRIRQIQNLMPQISTKPGEPNPFQQELTRLQAERSTLDQRALGELIEHRFVAREAEQRGISVTDSDEDEYIREMFGSRAPQPPPNATPSDVPPTPTVDGLARMRTTIGDLRFLSEDEFRSIVVRPTLLSRRLQESFGNEVPSTELQIHARHILVASEDEAVAVRARLSRGDPFQTVANDVTKDNASRDKGGDLGWISVGRMSKAFDEVAFQLGRGEISAPVKSDDGYHLIEVVDRDEARAIDEQRLIELRQKAYRDFVDRQMSEGFASNAVRYEWSNDKLAWAISALSKAARAPAPTP
jgi:parvulin-like peptidyl-prolyl isomerase